MAYSKERAANIVKSDIKYIPAGIIENVVLKSAKAEMSPNGNPFLELVFEKDGATMTHTEWEPKLGNYVTTQEQVQEKMDKQYSRMLQILSCYYDDSVLNFNGESFKEFINWVSTMLNSADKSKKLRAKIVYDNNGYTTFPNYAKYTFIEPMELPEGQTSAITALGIDRFTRPVIADKEVKNNNPFSATSTTTNMEALGDNTNDLPF